MTSAIWRCSPQVSPHAGADRRAVRAGAHALDQDRVVAAPSVVAEQGGRPVQVVHDHVHVAVVVEVPEGAAPAEVLGEDRRSRLRGDVLEPPVPQVAVEELGLPVLDVEVLVLDLGVHVAVRHQDVQPAVVVEVEEAHAEAHVLPGDAEAAPEARVLEAGAVVPVERRHLLGEVRPDDVQPPVGVVVAHARRPSPPGPPRFRRTRTPRGPRSPGTSRRGCCGRAGWARSRRRRRCRASRRCRSPPPPLPCRRSPWAASCSLT